MNPKQRREIKDWYTDLALGRTIKAEDIERPAAELARREQAQAPQHTPGPWGVGYGEDRVITIGPYPCVVADCAPNNELSLEEVAANAALIARAPELAAENARLRSLLAECVNDWREEIEQWRTAGQPHYAMALERCARDIAMRQEAIK